MLYLSPFFEEYKSDYYDSLLSVSKKGDWRGWIEFFLRGVVHQSKKAIDDARTILELNSKYKGLLEKSKNRPQSAFRLVDEIFSNPLVSISVLSNRWDKPYHYVRSGVIRLVEIGILKELTDRKRNKLYIATELMDILLDKKK